VAGTITPTFDGLDRLTSEVTSQGTVSYGYDAANRRTSMTAGNQSAVGYSYDNANRLTGITQGSASVSFAYDAANRRNTLTLPNGVVVSYSYDTASQLNAISYQLGSTSLGSLTYSYDLSGRRTGLGGSVAAVNLPLAVSTTAYNANNQLTTWGTANLYYDANGNMTSDGTNSYVWDARNQLASMNLGANSFQYGAYGRRVGKTISSTTTNYLYDGLNIAQEQVGGVASANLLSRGIDEVFTRTDSNGSENFLTDALGSTVELTNGSGTTLAQYSYEPFGNTSQTGTSTNPYQFTGREDDGTSLYFYRARYYRPAFGRFISEDPFSFVDGPNIYSYVHSSPLNLRDPFGLSASSAAVCFLKGAARGAAGALIVGGVAAVAVTAGAPVAGVTGIVFVAGIAGGVATEWDIYNQSGVRNWNRVAYDVGSVAGSAGAGAALAPVIGPAIAGGETTPGWSPAKDWANRFDPFFPGGSVWRWLGKGPDNAAAGGAAATAGSGTAMVGKNCGCN